MEGRQMEQMSKMSEDTSLLKSPITYGDILGAQDSLGQDAVTPEDAALMQSAETRVFGQTQKEGAASVMQAAAEENVKADFVAKDDHSQVAEEGMMAQEIQVPGAEIDLEYVAGQPVMSNITPTPTDSSFLTSDAVTIGDALEAAAVGAGDKPLDKNDARAIQSAVQSATGAAPTAGGLAAAAMSAADKNSRMPTADRATLADILMDASIDLDVDKVVTQEDAEKVLNAELRGSPTGEPYPGGVAAAVQAAADINDAVGLTAPSLDSQPRAFPLEDIPVPEDMSTPASEEETAGLRQPDPELIAPQAISISILTVEENTEGLLQSDPELIAPQAISISILTVEEKTEGLLQPDLEDPSEDMPIPSEEFKDLLQSNPEDPSEDIPIPSEEFKDLLDPKPELAPENMSIPSSEETKGLLEPEPELAPKNMAIPSSEETRGLLEPEPESEPELASDDILPTPSEEQTAELPKPEQELASEPALEEGKSHVKED